MAKITKNFTLFYPGERCTECGKCGKCDGSRENCPHLKAYVRLERWFRKEAILLEISRDEKGIDRGDKWLCGEGAVIITVHQAKWINSFVKKLKIICYDYCIQSLKNPLPPEIEELLKSLPPDVEVKSS